MNITFELYFDFWWRKHLGITTSSNKKSVEGIINKIKSRFEIENIIVKKVNKNSYSVYFDIIDNDNGYGLRCNILDYLEKIEKKIDGKYIFDYYWKDNENI